MKEIRVLIAHDRALIRSEIRAQLERLPELQIVAEANDGGEALRLIAQHQPDVALIDSAMCKVNGFEMITRARKESPGVRVIILSAPADEKRLRQALRSGATGYLTVTAAAPELEIAISTVANGKRYVSSAWPKSLPDFLRSDAEKTAGELTPRQREVLKLIAEGYSTKQIALALNIGVKTVETHRTLLKARLGIQHTAGLVRYAIKVGLIRLDD